MAMSIDRQIEAKRAALRNLLTNQGRLELHALFQLKAQESCPIRLGEKVEYEFGKYGRVDRIGFDIDPMQELEPLAEIRWTVWGHRINQNKQCGKRTFRPIGLATHAFQDGVFRPKPVAGATIPGRPLIFDLATRRRVS